MGNRALKVFALVSILVLLEGGLELKTYETIAPVPEGTARGAFSLGAPAFAQGVPADQFPTNEAGISAYVKVEQTIDLNSARAFFQGIQAEGTSYLIGIVEIKGLPEELWPHLYVNIDGWFLTYYSKYDPASKLMPWNGYEGGPITTTTLRDALVQFTTQYFASVQTAFAFSSVEQDMHYYDFRYPEARAFVLAADFVSPAQEDSLRYAIPTGVLVYEGSWAHYASQVGSWSVSQADGADLYRGGKGTYFECGLLQDRYLRKETAHTVSVKQDDWGGDRYSGIAVVFIYR